MTSRRYPRIDLGALALEAGADLADAFLRLKKIYADIDRRNATHTADLDLPCHRGCSGCCEEAVFLSPIEFFYAWDHAQRNLSDEVRNEIVARGLRIYRQHQTLIDALSGPVPVGDHDHTSLAVQLRFRCPLLGAGGQCQVYEAREVYARLFGCSFNEESGIYGCDLVGAHLADRTLTLVRAKPAAERILALPLSRFQQVYPWYFQWVYGAIGIEEQDDDDNKPQMPKSSLPIVSGD